MKTKTIYITDDDKHFDTESEALTHEASVELGAKIMSSWIKALQDKAELTERDLVQIIRYQRNDIVAALGKWDYADEVARREQNAIAAELHMKNENRPPQVIVSDTPLSKETLESLKGYGWRTP